MYSYIYELGVHFLIMMWLYNSVIFRNSQPLYFSRQSMTKNSCFWEKLKQVPTLILKTKAVMNTFNVEIKEPTSDSLREIILRILMILQKKQRC